jgi:thiol:disulfide interchange protein DsbD
VPFLLAAFGAGLLALVTPCVFPMIPVTLAFFTKQATAGTDEAAKTAARGKIVRLAAVYSLGIVLSFTAIGGVLAATIGASGANRLFTNPWLNLSFAVLFVVFGLALLELIELRLPAGLQRVTGAGSRHGGTLGVLGMGFAFVAAAFTCTAPFIGTVLVAAASASSGAQWVRPILGMTVFATALALPFFVLALFPSWLARLPRSGAWLSTVKGAMGFVELAAALKFLGDADRVMGWNLLPRPLFLAIWGILGLAAALWLLGVLRLGFSTPEGRPSPLRAAWAGVFALAGVYCLYGLTGHPLATPLVAFLPPVDYGLPREAVAGTQTADTVVHNGQVWYKTLDAGLKQAKLENKPVFIDFTGETCSNCRAMENEVFPVPAVKDAFSQFVRVQLYTDRRNDGGASKRNQDYQEKTFGDVALPLYAILSPGGAPSAHIAGQRGADEFLNFLNTGREKALTTQTASASE